MVKVLRKSKGSFSKIKCFNWSKSTICHYYIQNVKGRIQIGVYKISQEIEAYLTKLISLKVKKI